MDALGRLGNATVSSAFTVFLTYRSDILAISLNLSSTPADAYCNGPRTEGRSAVS